MPLRERADRRSPALLAALAVLLGFLVSVLPAAGAEAAARKAAPAPTGPRATWVWDRPDPRTLVSWASGEGVRELFVHVPWKVQEKPADLAWLRDVRTRSRAAGIRLAALGSETTWIDDPASAAAWQSDALATGLFDGVHLDVEPHLHPAWATDRDGVVRRWLDLLAASAAATSLPVEADTAFWLDQLTVDGRRVDQAVLDRVDAVTVMTYRDTVTGPDSITALGAAALQAGAAAGKPVRLAVETNFLGSDAVAQKQTFHGATKAALRTALAQVDAAVAGNPSYAGAYAGVAVHDRAGWTALAGR